MKHVFNVDGEQVTVRQDQDGRYIVSNDEGNTLADLGTLHDVLRFVGAPLDVQRTILENKAPEHKATEQAREPKCDYARWWVDAVGLDTFNTKGLPIGQTQNRPKTQRTAPKRARHANTKRAHRMPYGHGRTW